MASATRVKDLLEKTKNYDADERFMAMHDLVEQLKSMQGGLDAALQVSATATHEQVRHTAVLHPHP
jgi:hypothetical protein